MPPAWRNIAPIVTTKDGQVFANSRDVAEFFGKRHDHVLRDIDALIEAKPSIEPNFGCIEVAVKVGFGYRKDRAFVMDRDGFTLLAMGFTGSTALRFKLAYIAAFNEMEAKLKAATPALPNFTDPAEAAIAWATEYQEKQIAQVMPFPQAGVTILTRTTRNEGLGMNVAVGTQNLAKDVRGLLQAFELVEAFRCVRPEMPMQMASVFLAVAMKPGIYQRDLVPLLGMAQSSISRNVTALGPKPRHGGPGLNLVVQRHEPTEGKTYELHLTREGKELANRLLQLR